MHGPYALGTWNGTLGLRLRSLCAGRDLTVPDAPVLVPLSIGIRVGIRIGPGLKYERKQCIFIGRSVRLDFRRHGYPGVRGRR